MKTTPNPNRFPETHGEREVFARTAGMYAILYGERWCVWFDKADGARAKLKGTPQPVSDWLKTFAAMMIGEGICPN